MVNTSEKTLQLCYGGFSHGIVFPGDLYEHAVRFHQSFNSTFRNQWNRNEAQSAEYLVAEFMRHVMNSINSRSKSCSMIDGVAILAKILSSFCHTFLKANDIHCLAPSLPGDLQQYQLLLRTYYEARAMTSFYGQESESKLLQGAREDTANIFLIFGGQGLSKTYFEELRQAWATYEPLLKSLIDVAQEVLQTLVSSLAAGHEIFPHGINLLDWLNDPSTTPSMTEMVSAPLSCPLLALVSLSHFCITASVLNMEPQRFLNHCKGVTGHSQGIVVAAVVSSSCSWNDFYDGVRKAMTILFWIGVRSELSCTETVPSTRIIDDAIKHAEGYPSAMLSVRGLSHSEVDAHVTSTNSFLPVDEHCHVALINGSENIVVSGPPETLHGLCLGLRKLRQATVNTRRKHTSRVKTTQHVRVSFLPVSAPSHSPYLQEACEQVFKDVQDTSILSSALSLPIYHTRTGIDLSRGLSENDIVPELIKMIMVECVDWQTATLFSSATHVIDFGPGRVSGAGALLKALKRGHGVRILLPQLLDIPIPNFGDIRELLSTTDMIRTEPDWGQEYRPRLVKTRAGQYTVDTKFSRFFGLPPIMVAGMHPTTVSPTFVIAVMKAGFHTELAGGGFTREDDMENAIMQIRAAIPSGRGITCNLLYVSPRSLAWQIPMIAQLQRRGVFIEGITIGGGVPSLDIATDYINDLGLTYIAFKPSSLQSIRDVLIIAQAHPRFPIILQWTGGRGGGHHSNEDFHEAILSSYDQIRRCKNIILVAGSGFGGVEDTYAYLSGSWSSEMFGLARMPFDAIMLGSRMMASKEAPGSLESKEAIVKAEGTGVEQWWDTSSGQNGIISVKSEWGQPMHMIANRGTLFWAEMDKIFALEKSEKLKQLTARKSWIIQNLNADFQKPWFGKHDGEPVELNEMFYDEVLRRLIELMYVDDSRWVDLSWRDMVGDFCRRIEARFAGTASQSMLESIDLLDRPREIASRLIEAYPVCSQTLMIPQDINFFLSLCKRRGQKPVPFIPRLDADTELWMKKDSLWQSQDLAAVVGRDVHRVAILQGPVAARLSNKVGEPVQNILEDIHQGWVQRLIAEQIDGCAALDKIPETEHHGSELDDLQNGSYQRDGIDLVEDGDTLIISIDPKLESSSDRLLSILRSRVPPWAIAAFTQDFIMLEDRRQQNQIKATFRACDKISISCLKAAESGGMRILLEEKGGSGEGYNAELRVSGSKVGMLLSTSSNTSKACTLLLRFEYDFGSGYHPIKELGLDRTLRIKHFYYHLWFGTDQNSLPEDHRSVFKTPPVTITTESVTTYARATKNRNKTFQSRSGRTQHVPMDMAVVLARKCLVEPLFARSLDGDLLKLVHLSVNYERHNEVESLKVGDTISVESKVTAVLNTDHGKIVEVLAKILRDGVSVINVTSQVQFLGVYNDFAETFQDKPEPVRTMALKTRLNLAILRSKEWIQVEADDHEILGSSMEFQLATHVAHRDAKRGIWNYMQVSGKGILVSASGQRSSCAEIFYEGIRPQANPVTSFLSRFATMQDESVRLSNPHSLKTSTSSIITPVNNATYSRVSGDVNPIHTSGIFAAIAELPGTITHGMWTCAAVRGVIEAAAADNDPERMRSFSCVCTGMVLPKETLVVECEHIAMVSGRKLLNFRAINQATGAEVLRGQTTISQRSTAYVFTGQGSQKVDMGMDLYDSSVVARKVWDQAEEHFIHEYGFSILEIVRRNPKSLTIHLRGPRGRNILQNYLSLGQRDTTAGPARNSGILDNNIDEDSRSITFRHPQGLLFSTQFAQPALVVHAIAIHADLRSRGLIANNDGGHFAGHSLGEYAALASMTDMIPLEKWLSMVFFRGLLMQSAVERDENGTTDYAMVAVNPSRITPTGITEDQMHQIVSDCANETGVLLEIVNYNVQDQQYVCAGHIRALKAMQRTLNTLHANETIQFRQPTSQSTMQAPQSGNAGIEARTIAPSTGITPLPNIDIPFHSSLLRSAVPMFRDFLEKTIHACDLDPEQLIDRWIPNLVGVPFDLGPGFVERCIARTGESEIFARLVRT